MTQADIEAVLQQQSRFNEALNSADAEALIALADEAVTDMAAGMPAAAGKAAFAERARTIVGQYRTELNKHEVRQTDVSGDLAVVRSVFEGAWIPKDGSLRIELAGNWLQVWKRQPDGVWKLLHNIWNGDH
jgi:ketosteroid isomerase-like protein